MKICYKKKKGNIHVTFFFMQLIYLFTIKSFCFILGFLFVPLSLLFRKKETNSKFQVIYHDKKLNKHYKYESHNVHLPKLFWIWDDEIGGASSHNPRWWWLNRGRADKLWPMIKWLTIKNPLRNLKRTRMFNLNLYECDYKVVKKKNSEFIVCKNRNSGKMYYTYNYENEKLFNNTKLKCKLKLGFNVSYKEIEQIKNESKVVSESGIGYTKYQIDTKEVDQNESLKNKTIIFCLTNKGIS